MGVLFTSDLTHLHVVVVGRFRSFAVVGSGLACVGIHLGLQPGTRANDKRRKPKESRSTVNLFAE